MRILIVTLCWLLTYLAIIYITEWLDKPLRRVDILKQVLKEAENTDCLGLCELTAKVCSRYGLPFWRGRLYLFPHFTPRYAKEFGANDLNAYWWDRGDWNKEHGRCQFLRWLIEKYKNDTVDLKYIAQYL